MSFTSAVVAESHYQGKIHAKRLKLLLGEQPALKATGRCRGAGAEGCGGLAKGLAQCVQAENGNSVESWAGRSNYSFLLLS